MDIFLLMLAQSRLLRKFRESIIPKKGEGKTNQSLSIYEEPNTYSKIIGTIDKGQNVYWTKKSLCQLREGIKCWEKHSFGYIIATNNEGIYNIDKQSIIEKKVENKPKPIEKPINLTDEELKSGEKAYLQVKQDLKKKYLQKLDSEINFF